MIKLLMIGCNVGTESMPKYFREQCNYSELRLDNQLANNLSNLYAKNEIPDTIFLQIQSDTIDGKNTNAYIGGIIKAFRDKGAFVINWTGDLRNTTPPWMVEFAKNVSITMFSNMRDVEYCKARGINTGFLQQGIDTNIFRPDGVKGNAPEIVFLANNYVNQFPLSGFRKEAINLLRRKYGNRFKVYGNGWGADSGNVNNSQYEEAKIYRSAKIAISISHYNVDRYFSDRLGRALCSGTFVISHNYKGIGKDFEVDKQLVTFNDLNDMCNKIDYWLNPEQEEARLAIARAGQEQASKEFSYQNIIKQILELK